MLDGLRNIGVELHPPVLKSDYDYCGGKPFDIQRYTVSLLTENLRAYVLSSMGTGKTKCVCWAFDYLLRHGSAKKMLVVAPLSTLRFTWLREVFMTTPHLKCAILHGSKAERLAALNENADIYIINHDGVGKILHELVARKDIDVLCIDELAVYRNRSQRTKAIQHLANAKPVVWGMTGSPMPNAPTDVYEQAKIVTPNTVPKFFGRFRDDVMLKITQFKWVPKKGSNETAFRVLRPSVRYTLDDVMELPAFISRQQEVAISDQQKRIYKEIKNAAAAMVSNGQVTAANAGAVVSKLLQISLGYVYLNNGETADLQGQDRLDALLETVLASNNKVLVYVPYIHALNGVVETITSEGISVEQVSGETPALERDKIFRRFQNEEHPKVLAAHPQCVAHGITLTAADTIVWFGPITSSEIYDQANARIRRVGQKNKQLFLHLVGTPVEKHMYGLLTKKIVQQDDLLRMLEDNTALSQEVP